MTFTLNEAAGRTVGLCIDLSWAVVFACENDHGVTWDVATLEEKFPREAVLDDIARRLVCGACGSRSGVMGLRQDQGAAQRRDVERFEASAKEPGVGSSAGETMTLKTAPPTPRTSKAEVGS